MYLCGIALANQSNAGCGEIVNPLGEKPDPKLDPPQPSLFNPYSR